MNCTLSSKRCGSKRYNQCFYMRMDHQTHSQRRWLRVGLTACAAVSLIANANAGSPVAAPKNGPHDRR